MVKCDFDGDIEELHALSSELYGRHLAKLEGPLPPKCPWYGKLAEDVDASKQPHRFTPPDKRLQIAGFHGTFGNEILVSLGVFFQPIPASTHAVQPKNIDW